MADGKKTGSRGSATLELTIIFPVIMLVFFSLVFFSMHLYQKLIALDAAVYTASQASATWDNTHKEFEGGFLPAWNNDGLYWRLLNDRPGSGLAAEKTGYAGSFLSHRLAPGVIRPAAPADPEVEVSYDNSIVRRTVRAGVGGSLFSPVSPLIKTMTGDGYEISAESDVAEPAEFIRVCDLGGEYLKKIADYLGIFGRGGESGPGIVLTGSTYAGAGGKDERVYHYPGCRYIGRIKEIREFSSVAEAKAAGYHLCIKCAESRRKQLESPGGKSPDGSDW
ncbi:MAG: pilus assembly protein [Actinobacteria bacterium]|nr:pilus assembly protein [Actinomycetota bacterium]